MHICPVKTFNIKQRYCNAYPNIAFKNSSEICRNIECKKGQIIFPNGQIHNFGYTCYARGDINWTDLGKYLKDKFGDITRTNINVFACSSGEEAYTIAILLNKIYPDKKIKIKAIDIDKDAIERCKKLKRYGDISCTNVNWIKDKLDLNDKQMRSSFVEVVKNQYKINPKILETVDFETGNILTYPFKEESDKSSIIFMRNMWPYVLKNEYKPFADKLYSALAPNSIIVLGDFDLHCTKIADILQMSGFKSTYNKLVAEK